MENEEWLKEQVATYKISELNRIIQKKGCLKPTTFEVED